MLPESDLSVFHFWGRRSMSLWVLNIDPIFLKTLVAYRYDLVDYGDDLFQSDSPLGC